MAFMEVEMTDKESWWEVDAGGTYHYPCDYVSREEAIRDARMNEGKGSVRSCRKIKAYGVRLSAPGYLDATDWTVFTRKAEALEYARDLEAEGNGDEQCPECGEWNTDCTCEDDED